MPLQSSNAAVASQLSFLKKSLQTSKAGWDVVIGERGGVGVGTPCTAAWLDPNILVDSPVDGPERRPERQLACGAGGRVGHWLWWVGPAPRGSLTSCLGVPSLRVNPKHYTVNPKPQPHLVPAGPGAGRSAALLPRVQPTTLLPPCLWTVHPLLCLPAARPTLILTPAALLPP